MFAFIRSQPDVLARLLLHVETPSIVDLLVRIVQLDEQPTGTGVLEVSGISVISVRFAHPCGSSGYRQKISWVG